MLTTATPSGGWPQRPRRQSPWSASPSTWSNTMDPRDFHSQAVALLRGGRPVDCRSAISRAYYAAFHVAAQLLRTNGFSILENHTAHEQVTRHLLGSTSKHSRKPSRARIVIRSSKPSGAGRNWPAGDAAARRRLPEQDGPRHHRRRHRQPLGPVPDSWAPRIFSSSSRFRLSAVPRERTVIGFGSGRGFP